MGAWKNTSYRFTENLKHRFVRRKKKKTATSSAITSPPIQTDPKVYELRCLNCPFGPSPERRILSWNVALKCWSDGIYKCFFKLESKRRPLNIPRVRAPDVVQLGWNRGILWWTAEVQTMGQSQGYVFFGCKISAVVTLWIVVIHFRKKLQKGLSSNLLYLNWHGRKLFMETGAFRIIWKHFDMAIVSRSGSMGVHGFPLKTWLQCLAPTYLCGHLSMTSDHIGWSFFGWHPRSSLVLKFCPDTYGHLWIVKQ